MRRADPLEDAEDARLFLSLTPPPLLLSLPPLPPPLFFQASGRVSADPVAVAAAPCPEEEGVAATAMESSILRSRKRARSLVDSVAILDLRDAISARSAAAAEAAFAS